MNHPGRNLSAAILSLVASSFIPLQAAAEVSLVLDPERVEVFGATGGSEVVIVGVSRQLDGYISFVRTIAESALADAAGAASYQVPWPAESAATWAVVDVESGSFAVETARKRGAPHEPVEHPVAAALTLGGRRMLVVLVRPGAGAWSSAIGDGGSRDADGLSDGQLTVSSSELVSLGGESTSPERLNAGDLVIAIDQDTLEATVTSLVATRQGEE